MKIILIIWLILTSFSQLMGQQPKSQTKKNHFVYSIYYKDIPSPDGIAFDQNGDLLVLNESSPQGVYRAKEGDTFDSTDAVTTIGYPLVDPDDVLFYPDGTIYITDEPIVFKVEKGSKVPVPFITPASTGSPDFNPYGLTISPPGFDGPNVKPGDIIIADNGIGGIDRSVWAVDPVTGESRVINKGEVFFDGPLSVKFGPDGTLYVFENNDNYSGTSRIVILEANGDVRPFLTGIKERGSMAIHPITGDIYFKNEPGEIHWVSKSGGEPRLFVSNIGRYRDIEFNSEGTDLYVSASELNQVLKISGPFRNISDFLLKEYPALTIRNFQRQFFEHNNNNVKLSVSNHSVIGGKEGGFEYKGSNGLFEGALIIASSDTQISSGIYGSEFTPLSPIMTKLNKLKGFNQTYETGYTDNGSKDALGVTVIQRTHSKSSHPDKNYIILEYEVINTSGVDLDNVYIGLIMDWDISLIGLQDLAGYDFERNMIYMYNSVKSDESYYYGLSALSHEVSGYAFSIVGEYGSLTKDYVGFRGKIVFTDTDWYKEMTTYGQSPKIPADYRSLISVGPFNIPKSERVITRFAAVAGRDLHDLQSNLDAVPFWNTNWAYAVYVMMIGASVFGMWRFQVNRLKMRQKYEMEQFEASKLKEMDEMKSRFFANISHEFRTPLTLILGPLEKMLSKDNRDEKEKLDMLMMKRSGGRLLRLINQLLDLSKIESGDMSLKARSEDVIIPLRGIVNSFLSLAERKKITLEFNTPEEPVMVYIDRDKFEKIVTNLLSNAFKFTPEGGTVSVSLSVSKPVEESSANAKPVRHMPGKQSGDLLIEVKDSGVGIAPDQLDKVFDRFYQVDASHTREQEGTGIGLALTKDLVELHRGEISVSSEEGKGTVFIVRLPLGRDHLQESQIVEEPSEEVLQEGTPVSAYSEAEIEESFIEEIVQSEKKETKRSASKPILLIVEDNTDVRRYMRGYLDDSYHVMEAKDGVEGYEISTDTVPDLIISDVMMPIMDGIEMCEKIKTDERTSHIPVILLTAKADSESKLEGLETGADDYLTKPFDAKELLVRVKNLIEQRRKLREKFSKDLNLNPEEITVTSMDERFLGRAMTIVEKHMSDSEFSVKSFSWEIGMSRANLHKKMKALTDMSTSGFIRTIRLKRAASLLRQNFGNVTEVAYEVGFSNISHFAKWFKMQYGETPSKYS